MEIVNALWITLIGMGLVFLSILALWGLMALIVRLTTSSEESPEEDGAEAEPEKVSDAIPDGALLLARKRRAAAAAVAIAMTYIKAKDGRAKPITSVSAWQAVNRANQINQRMNATRKKVVR